MTVNAIPMPIQALLDLFATSLTDVRFADLDGETLAKCAGDVDAAAKAVAYAQSTLDAAKEALQVRQDALLQQAQRALAYAKVYAESDEPLTARLSALALPRPTRRARPEDVRVASSDPMPAPRPRGRPRKAHASESVANAGSYAPAIVSTGPSS